MRENIENNILPILVLLDELQEMLNDWSRESLNIGFKMNRNKTKIFYCKISQKIKTEDEEVEVQEYIYL